MPATLAPRATVIANRVRRRRRPGLAIKRAVDVLVAGTALVALAPLGAVVALVVARRGRPLLAREPQLGRDGEVIRRLRFGPLGHGSLALWLEAIGMRGLPQLLNVLSGDLSLIGPCAKPAEALGDAETSAAAGLHGALRPGLTGPAQVARLRGEHLDDAAAAAHDARYERDWTLALDARLAALTIAVALSPR